MIKLSDNMIIELGELSQKFKLLEWLGIDLMMSMV